MMTMLEMKHQAMRSPYLCAWRAAWRVGHDRVWSHTYASFRASGTPAFLAMRLADAESGVVR